MELNFEYSGIIGQGGSPDFLQFPKSEGQQFYIKNGKLMAKASTKFNDGDFSNPTWLSEEDVSPGTDENITLLELKTISGFGVIGSYLNEANKHIILIYEYQQTISDYLSSGSISQTLTNPIRRFNLSLDNPYLKDIDKPGKALIGEKSSLLSPGAKIIFKFGMGADLEEFDLGTFYVDRSNFKLLNNTISVDGRNKIGKVLKDQSLDELHEFWLQPISTTMRELLANANLTPDEYVVQNTIEESWFGFTPNSNYFDSFEKIFELLPGWKIGELENGTIIIGDDEFTEFGIPGNYIFYRDEDIFSRDITRDDAEVYRRVCVHTDNFAIYEYRDIEDFQGWNLQSTKTLYVKVSDGSSTIDISNYADTLVTRLANVGKIESFTGPFRPYIECGDGATIISSNGTKHLGLITEITHDFGNSGFSTSFSVDSGGTLGLSQISDYIKKITGTDRKVKDTPTKVGKSAIDTTSYMNIATSGKTLSSSVRNAMWANANVIDGIIDSRGWQPYNEDLEPYIKVDFEKQCSIDKIKIWLGDGTGADLPEYYTIQYWDSRAWIDLMFVDTPLEFMEHTFVAVNTTSIKILPRKIDTNQNWREIELWGNI